MKVTICKPVEYEACLIEVNSHIRYAEDITYQVDDSWKDCDPDCPECPCFEGVHQWKPIININTGYIINWPGNVQHSFHVFAKVCDEFACKIKGLNGEVLIDYEGYVPDFMAIEDRGYGDYIDMIVYPDGKIKDWSFCQNDIDELL